MNMGAVLPCYKIVAWNSCGIELLELIQLLVSLPEGGEEMSHGSYLGQGEQDHSCRKSCEWHQQ